MKEISRFYKLAVNKSFMYKIKQKKATKFETELRAFHRLRNIHSRRDVSRTQSNIEDGDFCKNS